MDKSSQELRTVSANLFWKSAPVIDAKYLKIWLQALKKTIFICSKPTLQSLKAVLTVFFYQRRNKARGNLEQTE